MILCLFCNTLGTHKVKSGCFSVHWFNTYSVSQRVNIHADLSFIIMGL